MDSDSSRRPSLCDLLGVGNDGDGDRDREEGEYVPGDKCYHSSSDTDNDDDKHGGGTGRMRRLDDIIAVGAGKPLPASPTTPSSGSEGTISDDSSGDGKLACHVCGKGFSSRKAVDGHMRVHASGGGSGARHVVAHAAPVPFSGGWAATGRRGCTGGRPSAAAAASLNSEATTDHSTAIVVAQVQPLEPVPMAFAVRTNLSPMPSSTRTNLSASGEGDEGSSASATATVTAQPVHHDEPVVAAAVVTGANPASSTVAGARAAGPVDHQLAVADHQAAPAPAPQVHRQAVPVPPPAAHFAQQQPLVPPPAAGAQLQQVGQLVVPRPALPPREYSCKECGKTYPTHQGLGGHAAGHKNRQREQEAAMAAAAGMMPNGAGSAEYLAALRRGGRKAEQPHACHKCNKVFTTGVALGGHMRMHYTGPPIVHKSKKRSVELVAAAAPPAISEADLRLALSTAMADVPSTSTAPPAVAATGRLRLFGIDIGPLGQQAPSSEQQGSGSGGSGPSGTTEEGSSSAGEQQHK